MNKGLQKTAGWLLAVGGINWGLAIFNVNLVDMLDGLVGGTGILKSVVYGAIGVAGVIEIPKLLK